MIVTTPASLTAWLASARAAQIFDAYTLISATGVIARWLDADFDYTLPDARRFVRGPIFKRGSIRQTVGLSVDNLSLAFYPQASGAAVMFGGQSLLAAAQNGSLRGASLLLERLIFDVDHANTYKGLWTEFAGTMAVKNTAGGVIKADVLSELNLLDTPMPRDIYQSQCKNQVFDARCGLNKAAWQTNASVGGISSGAANFVEFTTTLQAIANGWFDQGVLQFVTGSNAGIKRTVKSFAFGAFKFALPWPRAIQAGDTFIAWPGCSRNKQVCESKFNNLIRYRGEPFIPQPETVN